MMPTRRCVRFWRKQCGAILARIHSVRPEKYAPTQLLHARRKRVAWLKETLSGHRAGAARPGVRISLACGKSAPPERRSHWFMGISVTVT